MHSRNIILRYQKYLKLIRFLISIKTVQSGPKCKPPNHWKCFVITLWNINKFLNFVHSTLSDKLLGPYKVISKRSTTLSGVARRQRLGAKLRGFGGRKSPAGSRGRAPVGVWVRSPQKLKNTTNFALSITLVNAKIVPSIPHIKYINSSLTSHPTMCSQFSSGTARHS